LKAPDTFVAEAPRPQAEIRTDKGGSQRKDLIERYRRVRDFTARLCRNLQP